MRDRCDNCLAVLQPVSPRLSAPWGGSVPQLERLLSVGWLPLQSDGVRERPSEKEAEATLAAGGDLDVGDGHRCHLPPNSQPPADDQPPAEGRVTMGAAAARQA